MGEWQPIETAPKDQHVIITGRYANGRAYVEACSRRATKQTQEADDAERNRWTGC